MRCKNLKLPAVFVIAVLSMIALGSATHPASAAQQKERERPKADNSVKGTLASVDTDKNSITITIHSFDRKTETSTDTNKTFTLAKDAKILQDEAPAKLADLKKGHQTVIKLDGTTATSV